MVWFLAAGLILASAAGVFWLYRGELGLSPSSSSDDVLRVSEMEERRRAAEDKRLLLLEKYNTEIKASPQTASLYLERGAVHGLLRNYRSALHDFEMALSLGGEPAAVYRERAVIRRSLREFGSALDELSRAF